MHSKFDSLDEDGKLSRRPAVLSGASLAFLSFSTLGVIYSDIGTSYTLNGIWPSSGPAPSVDDVIGGCSAIIWSLFLLPVLKYCLIALRFGTEEGEGGTFALLQGLYPQKDHNREDDRSIDSTHSRRLLESVKWPLTVWGLFGTALTMADGIFTPAVSVTSAVGGIAVAKPNVEKNITAISIAFLIPLFLIQRLGTHRIAATFAPVTFVWLLLLAGTGMYNISYYPGVFRALDPSRAIMWFVRTKTYDYLAGVLLALTGCEAMFANLGQFNALSIQVSFSCFVFPSLVFAYLGQGARIIHEGDAVMSNIFFNTIPGPVGGGLYWVIFVVSILATLIASQTLLTATSSLVQQLVNFKSLPPFRLLYTNDRLHGQVYVPVANYLLGMATIIVVGVFKNLANMSNAYGFSVATVMIVTSTFIAIQIYYVKQLPLIISFVYFVPFVFLDGLFWGAALKKVPHGAWVPLMIGSILTILMAFWTWARGLEDDFDRRNRRDPHSFLLSSSSSRLVSSISEDKLDGAYIVKSSDPTVTSGQVIEAQSFYSAPSKRSSVAERLALVDSDGNAGAEVYRLPTAALFYKLTPSPGVPHAFYGWVQNMPALPRLVIFLSVRLIPLAHVDEQDRYSASAYSSIKGFYDVTYNIGFRDDFKPSAESIVQLVSELEGRADPPNALKIIADLKSMARIMPHIIPHHFVTSKHINFKFASGPCNAIRQFLIEGLYRRLATMFPGTANWNVNQADILRVGVNAPI
ncbi:potassium transporter [Clavulina sp. PMI_390]|nr:potassium transporter [Clavulina sp. PMI_390]